MAPSDCGAIGLTIYVLYMLNTVYTFSLIIIIGSALHIVVQVQVQIYTPRAVALWGWG